jgi:hypothetical protein
MIIARSLFPCFLRLVVAALAIWLQLVEPEVFETDEILGVTARVV